MPKLRLASTKDYLLKDGQPFFYLADTVWMAFANLSVAYILYHMTCEGAQISFSQRVK